MVRGSASEAGGCGFDTRPRHTKDVKNGTSSYLDLRSLIYKANTDFSPTPSPRGGTLIFCGYIGEAPASTPKPKKLLRFADHPKKIPVLSGIPKKILELLAYPKKLHVFIFFMPIDEILSHPYDLSCWWDVKSQINQPTEHVTIQLVYVGTRK